MSATKILNLSSHQLFGSDLFAFSQSTPGRPSRTKRTWRQRNYAITLMYFCAGMANFGACQSTKTWFL